MRPLVGMSSLDGATLVRNLSHVAHGSDGQGVAPLGRYSLAPLGSEHTVASSEADGWDDNHLVSHRIDSNRCRRYALQQEGHRRRHN